MMVLFLLRMDLTILVVLVRTNLKMKELLAGLKDPDEGRQMEALNELCAVLSSVGRHPRWADPGNLRWYVSPSVNRVKGPSPLLRAA